MNAMPVSTHEELKVLAQELYRHLSPIQLDKLAREMGVIKRKRKVKAEDIISLCVFLGDDWSSKTLTSLCGLLDANTGISLSTEGLNQRFNANTVKFLQTVFSNLLQDKIAASAKLPCQFDYFPRIRILDSTSFGLPASYASSYPATGCSPDKAGLKIQLEYDLKSGDFLYVDVESGKTSDCEMGALRAKTVEKGDLCLRDLGYFRLEDFNQIEQSGAYYITRIKPTTHVYTQSTGKVQYLMDGRIKKSSLYNRINLREIMDAMEPGEVLEFTNVLVGQNKKVCARLVLYKLTDEQLEKRQIIRSKKENKKMKSYKEETKQFDPLHAFITNTRDKLVPKENIYDLYSLRWQIEILFKTWKSIFHIHTVKSVKEDRFKCQLYGTLIALLLSSTLMFKMREVLLRKKKLEISELKSMYILKQYLAIIHKALRNEVTEIQGVLQQIYRMVEKNGQKSHRYKKKTVFDILGVVYELKRKAFHVAA